jgi:hypothetical protein
MLVEFAVMAFPCKKILYLLVIYCKTDNFMLNCKSGLVKNYTLEYTMIKLIICKILIQ